VSARLGYAPPVRAVVQRVSRAEVSVAGEAVGAIGSGLVSLVGVAQGDTEIEVGWMATRLCGLRVFEDDQGKMNLALADVEGSLLLVPNFTVCGDASRGRRPSFTQAAEYEAGRALFDALAEKCRSILGRVETGRYGAEMSVSIVNDGPVTLVLETPPRR
jgi:D-tyrosyl-tRNA(Tyr) deacylase